MNVLDIWGICSATLQILVNLLDIQGLWSVNLLDIWSLWSTNHPYICEWARAYKTLIVCIFVNICSLWGANLRNIWGIWRTNHLSICKSGYSGPESPVYLQISWYVQISWIFANLINIPKGAWISLIFLNLLDILVSPGNLEYPWYWGSMKCKWTGYS